MVATSWKGHEYLRTYVVPHDPKTERQMAQRGLPKTRNATYTVNAMGRFCFVTFRSRAYCRFENSPGRAQDCHPSMARDKIDRSCQTA